MSSGSVRVEVLRTLAHGAVEEGRGRMTRLERELPAVSPQCDLPASPQHGVPGSESEACRANLAKKANIVSTVADGGITEDVEDHRDRLERGHYFGPLGQCVDRSAATLPVAHSLVVFHPHVEWAASCRSPRQESDVSGVQYVEHAGHD
jgi:hypothetical protein